ncbi:IclR family transcriptional regulator [Ruegeria hyattellae]|uniref:IclR family transcriptional regulator n=1 Tax=Ruegeria hyattellae TaxID=3233337 RepID=UPI00355B6A41
MSSESYQLKTLLKAMQVLQLLEKSRMPMSLTEISNALGMQNSIVFRILKTLESAAYIGIKGDGKQYEVINRGDNLVAAKQMLNILDHLPENVGQTMSDDELSNASGWDCSADNGLMELMEREGLIQLTEDRKWSRSPKILRFAKPFLTSDLISSTDELVRTVHRETNESVGVFSNLVSRQVLVSHLESNQAVKLSLQIGSEFSLFRGAAGKASLAAMTDDEIRGLAEMANPEDVPDMGKLMKEITGFRERGFAISVGERLPDSAAVACALCDTSGAVRGAIIVQFPAFRVSREGMMEIGEYLAKQVSDFNLLPTQSTDPDAESSGPS